MFLSRYQLFRWSSFAFLMGVACAYAPFVTSNDAFMLLGVSVALIIFGFRKRGVLSVGLVALFFFSGALRVTLLPQQPVLVDAKNFSFVGSVRGDPTFSHGKQKVTVVVHHEGTKDIKGVLTLSVPLTPLYAPGDILSGTCPRVYGGSPSFCPFANITAHSKSSVSFASVLFSIRSAVERSIDQSIASPASDLLAGLLVGAHGSFSDKLKDTFRKAGLSHIVAISGYNISLIISGLWVLLRKAGVARKQGTIILLAGTALFVLLTGASSSAVRAAVMGGLVVIAGAWGRPSQASHALLAAMVVMVAVDPSILLFGVGFQLSCLATAGLIYLAPLLASYVRKVPELFGIKEICVQTISATICTIPLLAYVFQGFSAVGILANSVVVPLIPLIMGAGFAWTALALCSLGLNSLSVSFIQPLVDALAVPVSALLFFVVSAASFFSSLPFSYGRLEDGTFGLFEMLVSYGLITFLIAIASRRRADLIV